MNKLEKIINYLYQYPSDINEHFPALIEYGSQCDHITEMGVRWITSTWAFLGCAPKKLVSYDMQDPSFWDTNNPAEQLDIIARGYNKLQDVYDVANEFGLDFRFIQANVLNIEIEETDLLFIDTCHTYKHLKEELKLHAHKVKKYIIFHDTTTYAYIDETNYDSLGGVFAPDGGGIWKAIEEFLQNNPHWELEKRYMNNNGLTIIKNKYLTI
jgi:hypothetical protein